MKSKTKLTNLKRDDPAQSRTFIEKAREVGADEGRSAADDLMRELAKMPHEPRSKSIKKP